LRKVASCWPYSENILVLRGRMNVNNLLIQRLNVSTLREVFFPIHTNTA